MVSGFLPYSRGDLETLTASSGVFILQAEHRETFDKSWAGANLGGTFTLSHV